MSKEQVNFIRQSSDIKISLDIRINYFALQALVIVANKLKTN